MFWIRWNARHSMKYLSYQAGDQGYHKHSFTLLRAFIEYILSPAGQASLESFFFKGVPLEVITMNMNTIQTVVDWGTSDTWVFEPPTQLHVGTGERVISAKRKSYASVARESMEKDIAALQADVAVLEERLEYVNSNLPLYLHFLRQTSKMSTDPQSEPTEIFEPSCFQQAAVTE